MSCRGRGHGRGRGHHEHPGHPGHHEHHEHHEHHGHRGHHEHHGHRGVPGHRGHHGHHEFGPQMGQVFQECGTFPFMEHVEITIPAEVSKPLIQPPIPYVGPIPGGIKPGMRLHVVGTVPANAQQFQINFKTGVKDSDDVAFHFNPRFGQCVYMNIFRKGAWQKEELGPDKPFVKGSPFKLLFIINKDNYEVHVNGSHIYTFSHRIPLESVTTLAILGDVLIFWLGFENLTQTVTSTFTISSEVSNPILQPKIPYAGPITGGIKSGMRLHVEGAVPANAQQFQINFKTGVKDSDDVAFHFNPRFGQCVYMNIFRKGAWQKEELGPVTPFVKGSNFKLLFIINKDNYEVHVNGTPLYRFNHRIPIESITTLAVLGDVLIYWMGFEKSAAASLFKESKVILMGIGLQAFIPLEVYYPITNPAIPYVGQIPGGIKKNFAVVFQGTVPADSKGFDINFKTGPAESDDIAFHYNPRIGNCTAMNTLQSGCWLKQENAPDKPFTRGGGFIILFIINAEGYEVYVNGFKQCTFKHRIPLEKISTLNIRGNVSIHVCGFIDGWSTTSTFTELKKITATQTSTSCATSMPFEISHSISNPKLPYVGKIPGGFKQDMAVFLQGTLPAEAKSFEMNFKTGTSDADDTAFHYKPHIGDRTVLNSCRSGSWETEESASDKPFTKGGVFQIFVAIKSDGYEVYTNGVKHCTFKHRIPLDKVSAITFNGDISFLLCGFIQKWTCPSLFIQEKKSILMGSGSSTFIPLEISNPVSNPAVPYVGEIAGGIKQDVALVFQGTVPANAKSFEMNFKTGPADGDDIAFHYKPVFGANTSLNTFRNGNWEKMETAPVKNFTQGGAFIILFVINAEGYEVYVNGFKHCTFKHRIPLEKVSTFNVRGDVSLQVCGLIDGWSTTPSFTELKKITATQTSTSCVTSMPLEISHPISNPKLPYVGKIPGGFKQDMAVFLQGTLPAEAKSFEMNFKTGTSDADDTAFHYKPHIGDRTVLNSCRKGSWETEESATDKPFTKGGVFQIFVAIKSDGYEVYTNGVKHCTFKHRIPLEKVSAITFNGDISSLLCGFIQKWTCPSLFIKEKRSILMGSGSSTFIPLEISDPVSNPAVPYVGKIAGGIRQDVALVFQGTVPADAKSFEMNFKTGPADGDDIAFHYKPVFGANTSLNTFRNGNWEKMETAPVKNFTQGGAFIILFVINAEGYEVYVNGFKHCTFKHRIPLEKVSTFNVRGDVSLQVCGLIDGWSTTPSFTELKKITATQTSTSCVTSMPLEISHPISNPKLPYVGKIPGGFKQDMAVFLQGTLPAEAKSFEMNFKTGTSDADDTAFHYKPHIGDRTVLNSCRNGSWETEESATDKPFTKGGVFQIFVAIKSDGYEVYTNGVKHCTFKHRIPLEKVSAITFNGDISSLLCGFIQKWTCPSLFIKEKRSILMGSGSSTFIPLEISDPVSNPAVPYVGKIAGGIKQDVALVFQGTVPADAKSFEMNFKTGPADGDDIAFHYKPVFGANTSLNTFRNGNWEKMETAPVKNFTQGGAFIILFVINAEGYEVYVNGFKHCTFKHRIPLEKVSTFNVRGDVSLQVCGLIDGWSTTPSFTELKKITATQTSTSCVTSMPLEISHPISNPKLPYVGKIPGGFKQDMAVFLQGTLPAEAKSFEMNFKTGTSDADDTAFHYKPHIGDRTVLNSCRKGSWETEESATDKPFTKGGVFQIFVAIKSDGYEVYTNGVKHCTFKHRIPLEKVSAITFNGDISSLLCGFIQKWTCPSLFIKEKRSILMGSGSSTFIPLEISDPVSNPAVPYVGKIAGGIKQDVALVFQGTVPADAKSFEMNFKTGPADGDDIAFHYKPVFGANTSLNTFRNGNWEKMETAPVKNFTQGGAFIILFVINAEGYEVYVNGFKHCTFKHRIPLEKVSTFNVRGDVSLQVCGLIDGWSTTPSFTELKKITATQTSTSCVTSMPLEISHPISNPKLPYVGKIPGGFKQDMAVFLQGTLPAEAKSFEMNFKTGTSDADDTAFHYKPHIGDRTVLNSCRNGSWETEESATDKPFTKGGVFQIFVAIKSDGYEVYTNGVKHCTFKHRIPLEKVSAITFNGDISSLLCGFIQKWTCPSLFIKEKKSILMGSGSSTFIPLEISNPVSNPAVPYVGEIAGGIRQDVALVFQGTVPADAKSFEINFKTGPADGDDIAFHYKPVFGANTSLNTFRNGNWEKMETAPVKNFTQGGAFIILFVINAEGYEVYVNGFKHCTFKHRIPLDKVSTFNVRGDVSLQVCGLIDGWSTTPSFTELKKITATQTSTSCVTSMPLEISHPISNPKLPYVGKIPGGFKQDMAVFLQGTLPAEAKSFEMNFKTGTSDADDTAFHYKPHIGDRTVLNSFRNGSWETEESATDKPFTKGGVFQIFVAIKSDGYEVYTNGVKHCTFKHRIPLEKVSAITFNGDISSLLCGFIQKWTCPSLFIKEKKSILMGSGSSTFIPLEISDPVSNPAVPYVGEIAGGIRQDVALVFQGTVPADAKSFEINFKTGPADGDDIAFHYKPVFGANTSLNTFRNGNWEKMETAPVKNFTQGGAFIILFVINTEGYEVYVNGFKHCTFKHRIPLDKVSTFNVRGDVSLQVCGLIDGWSTTPSFTELKKITATQTSTSCATSMPLEISHPISNPKLPYVGKIPGGFKQDMAVFLQGTLPAEAKSFEMNFKTGTSDADDTAFHYKPHIGDRTVLNSCRNGSWETEESASDKPFTKGGVFQIFVAIKSDGYEVYTNGVKHCTFKHRIPLEKVSAITFNGDISSLLCGFIQKWTCPSLFIKEKRSILMGSGSSTFIPLEISDPVSNPAVPYVGKIAGGINQDVAVVFQGTVPADAKSFEINFKTGPADGDDIAFHYKPVFGANTSLNSFRNGNWEKMETAPVKNFTQGGAFIILFFINAEGYEVYVNGFKHCTFKHRIPLDKVSTFNVRGDVSLQVCGLIDGWSTTPSFTELKKITATQTSTSCVSSMPLEISHPISNPKLPYVGKIPGGFKQDMAVFLQGTLPAEAKSFEMNFKTGTSDADDTAFHYKPHIGDRTVLNSCRNGSWETEESASDKPFTKGGVFQIFVAIKSDGYEVYTNGVKHCTFKHRIPLEKISAITFNGDISSLLCGFIQKWTCPSLFIKEKRSILMGSGSSTFIPLEISDPVSNLALPYVGEIPGGVKQDMAVVFQGTLLADAKRFDINFKSGPAEGDDIAFHYNPRIGNCTAMNNLKSGSWGKQENAPDKPFTRGEGFIILFIINAEGYEVYVNGLKHCTFKHRIPLEKVTTLNIHGNVSPQVCGFINSWSTTSSFTELKKIATTQTSTSCVTSMPLEISHPISNPKLPYVGKIPGGLKQDMAVFLQGTLPAEAKSFEMNFKTGTSDADDTAFHYKPHIGDRTVLNSCRSGSWETEESATDKPFTKGGVFQIFVAIKSDGYEVYTNGVKHCTFKHRIPLEKVSAITFNGDISSLLCGFIQKWTCPSLFIKEKKSVLMGSGSGKGIPLEISDPVSNPAIPYVSEIPGGIKQDLAVVFQGTVPADAKSFEINFKTGPADGHDIAFHYKPVIGEHTALNSFRNGSWETVETATDEPFRFGGNFIILFIITANGYEVYVNGLKHCTFKHRIPLDKVSTFNVRGDVSLQVCGLMNNWSTTSSFSELKKSAGTWTSASSFKSLPLEISQPVVNPALPYVGKIPGGIKKDMALFFQGSVPADAKGFDINFKTGSGDSDDIAFQYNPHFGEHTSLNSFRAGKWDQEENAPDKPFTKGEAFQMIIVINSDGYEVYVNGVRHCTFKHRIPLEKVSTLRINGHVSPLLCGFIHSWSTSSFFTKLQKIVITECLPTRVESGPLQISHPISNPVLPYVGEIPGGLKQDMAVFFQGSVLPDAGSFCINFKTGKVEGDDIAFHFNPRMGCTTALNSFRSGSWGTQEDAPDKTFAKGEAFQMIIVINSEGYEVYVNGVRYCTFKHRIPLEKVSTLQISGQVSLLVCGFIHSWSTSSFFTKIQEVVMTTSSQTKVESGPLEISHPISNPALPYVGEIPGGLKQDMAVFFQGSVLPDAGSFCINFKTGKGEGDDIAFHFNPRMGCTTALNSFRSGSWGTQEDAPDKTFAKGEAFQMIIVINSEGYEVYVNGLRYCTFKHRIPLEKVSTLQISGQVSLLVCGFIHSWSTSSFFTQLQEVVMTESSQIMECGAIEISHAISNPALPYVGEIPGGLKQDMAVFFQGSVPPDGESFCINFKTGRGEGDDIAFHFNPRMGGTTTLNSFRNGGWDKQEDAPDNPFTKGGAFQMIIVINSAGYEVYVNGLRHCVFMHRLPLEKVLALAIDGHILLSICGFVYNWSSSSMCTEIMKFQSTQSSTTTTVTLQVSQPISNPVIPFEGKIPVKVKQDMAVLFQGNVLENGNSFIIDFTTGGKDIAFHYNPRIGNFTALNNLRNGNWDTQENAPDKPFAKGQAFQIIVVFKSEGYEVYVNNMRHCTYKHRIPLENVTAIGVNGDVALQLIGFIENWKSE